MECHHLSTYFINKNNILKGVERLNTKSELNSVKKLVLRVLEQYPETRNSDTKLYLQCAREMGARTFEDLERINLNIISVHKARQPIQNKLGLFKPSKQVEEKRLEKQMDMKEYFADFSI